MKSKKISMIIATSTIAFTTLVASPSIVSFADTLPHTAKAGETSLATNKDVNHPILKTSKSQAILNNEIKKPTTNSENTPPKTVAPKITKRIAPKQTNLAVISPLNKTAYITTTAVYLNPEPTVTSTHVALLQEGDMIHVIGRVGNGWYKATFNGQVGYINSYYFAFKNNTTPVSPVSKKIYNTVNYPTTMSKYVAAELKNYINCVGGGLSKSQLNTIMTELQNAINPNAANTIMEFLRVDNYRNVNEQALANLLAGKGVFSGEAQAFIDAAKEYNLDPLYLVAQSALETGWGSSNFANGITITQIANTNAPIYTNGVLTGYQMINLPQPTTVYNLFGTGADNSTASFPDKATVLGTTYAYNHGWTNVPNAIAGAAQFLSNGYIHNPDIAQNTPYEIRYIDAPLADVWHQYCSNIYYAEQMASIIASNADIYSPGDTFTFDIPVFKGSTSAHFIGSGTISFSGGSYTDLQTGASWNANYAGSLNNGVFVSIIQSKDGWYEIAYNGGTAWVPCDRVNTSLNNQHFKTIANGVIHFKGGNYTDVMFGPSWNDDVAGTLTNGTTVDITGKTNGWYRISVNGKTSWVLENRVQLSVPKNDIGVGTVSFSGGNYTDIQSGPNWENSSTVATLNNGTFVNILSRKDGWYEISYNGGTAWILSDRVNTSLNNEHFKTIAKGTIAFKGGPYTDVQSGPSWNDDYMGMLNNGTPVDITGKANGWYRISANGKTSWVLQNRVQLANAKKYMGTGTVDFSGNPYTYVQNGPSWVNNSSIGSINNGTAVNIISRKDGWYEIAYNGGTAWILSDRVNTSLNNEHFKTIAKGMINFTDGSYTDVQSGPSWNDDYMGALNNGTLVDITGEANGWYRISANGKTSWVLENRVQKFNGNVLGTGTVNFNNSYTYVQSGPDWANSETLGQVNTGTTLVILGRKDGWYKIAYNGSTAWIPCNRVQTSLNNTKFKTIQTGTINFAGGPYTYIQYGPSWNDDFAGQLNNGTQVQITGEANGWYRINFNNTSAWVLQNRVTI